jgi:sulfofructose kinase
MSTGPLIVALGQATLQFAGEVPRLPDSEHPVELGRITIEVGGNAALAAATAAALGCAARLACKLADDFAGAFILQALRRAGIDVRGSLNRDCQLSGLHFRVIQQGSDRALSFFTRGDAGELDRRDFDLDALLGDARAVLLDGYYLDAQLALAEAARARGIPVIFDGSALRDGTGELIAVSDVLISSERMASELAPRDDLRDSLLELQELGPRAVIITLGANGSVGLHGDEHVEQPAFPVDAVESNGAGAVYHGAFAAALLSDLPFHRCMQFASAAAALFCRQVGTWASIPRREEVIDLVRRQQTPA